MTVNFTQFPDDNQKIKHNLGQVCVAKYMYVCRRKYQCVWCGCACAYVCMNSCVVLEAFNVIYTIHI